MRKHTPSNASRKLRPRHIKRKNKTIAISKLGAGLKNRKAPSHTGMLQKFLSIFC